MISIIVPVYNTENYIHQCLDSVLAQTFRDFELILVDDGSPDGSGAICDAYAKKDARVRVLHKKNGGVSSARNAGLDAARGEYVVFIDSDDCVNEGYLSGLLSAAEQNSGRDTLVLCDYQPFNEDGDEKRRFPEAFSAEFDGGTAQNFRELVFGFRLFPPYCKLYRRDIIEENALRYSTEIRTAEDFDFNMRYLQAIDRIVYVPQADYRYRVGYKNYRPSNHGVLGDSEIRSAHIMANGISDFAKRLGVYDEVYDEICLWAARKHYFNRLPMLFAESSEVSTAERRSLYRQLTADDTYRSLYKRGIGMTEKSTTQLIGSRIDCFDAWLLFWKKVNKQVKQSEKI